MTPKTIKKVSDAMLEERKDQLLERSTEMEHELSALEHKYNLLWAEIRRINREVKARAEKRGAA